MNPLSISVDTSATMIAPPRFPVDNPPAWPVWVAGTVVNGQVVTSSKGGLFWCIVGGTSAVEPAGAVLTDGSVQWAQILPGRRREINVVNTGATVISVSVGAIPTAGQGQVLQANGSYNSFVSYADPVYAISNTAGGTVSVQDL